MSLRCVALTVAGVEGSMNRDVTTTTTTGRVMPGAATFAASMPSLGWWRLGSGARSGCRYS